MEKINCFSLMFKFYDVAVSDKKLTNRLIGKDFCSTLKCNPISWKSLKTGREYSYYEFLNHGFGGIKHDRNDLPKDEYPYALIFDEEDGKPFWMNKK